MTRLLAVLATALALAACASAGTPYTASFVARGAAPSAGERWSATVSVRRDGRPAAGLGPVLRGQLGTRVVTARATALGRGRYRFATTFPAAGSWKLSVRIGQTRAPLGRLRVSEAPLLVTEPFDLVAEPDGTLLVADGRAGRLLRVDPRTRTASAASGPLGGRPVAVVHTPAGRVYASVGAPRRQVVLVDGAVASAVPGEAGALALAPDGDLLILVWAGTIFRLDAETGALTTFAGRGVELSDGDGGPALDAGFLHPHGAVSSGDDVYVADTYAGRVRRIDADGVVSTVASGLGKPVDLAFDRDGTLLVVDVERAELSRVDAAGRITRVSGDLAGPTSVVVAGDGTLYVGDIERRGVFRIDRASGRATRVTR